MKNKSARHKSENTFKFQPFSDRIANINVDIFHRVAHANEEIAGEHESIFYLSLEKWEVLNLAESYGAFRKEIRPHNIITLPQVLHEQDRIVNTLITHLEHRNVLNLQPLLEHVVALSKDLCGDFYRHYPRILTILLELLTTKDTDVLEWTFHCLAYLFKFLWRPLIKDIDKVFLDLLPLLSDDKPEYINNFAAESFAFVARKVKDRKNFLNVILETVKDHKNGTRGCGQLLFHVLHGVSDQFHSCADSLLPFLLDSLLEANFDTQSTLFEILEHVVNEITLQIHAQKNELFWSTFEKSLDKCIDLQVKAAKTDGISSINTSLNLLLMLVERAIKHKSGKFLKSAAPIIERLIRILSLQETTDDILLTTIQIALQLLLSSNIKLQQEHASALTLKILSISHKPSLLHLIDNAHESAVFEILILPRFLKICCAYNFDEDCVHVLTRLIIKKSGTCCDGLEFSKWNKYPLNGGAESNEILKAHFKSKLCCSDIPQLLECADKYICAVICTSHLVGIASDVTDILAENIRRICSHLSIESLEVSQQQQTLVLLNFTLQCLLFINAQSMMLTLSDVIIDTLLPLCSNTKMLLALKSLDLLFTSGAGEKCISISNLEKLHGFLESNFNSPYSEMRLLTSHIYSLFEDVLNETMPESNEPFTVFSICFQIESINPQVDTYREQLNLLEKFSADRAQVAMCQQTKYSHIPLRYLCGVLYINFKLFWEATAKIIATHANCLEVNSFWPMYGAELKSAVNNVINAPTTSNESTWKTNVDFINDLIESVCSINSKPDFVNYRLLLWRSLEMFPNIAEAKTRDISDIFLRFFKEEYTRVNSDSAMFWNIKQNAVDVHLDDTMDNSIFDDEVDDVAVTAENDAELVSKSKVDKSGRKIISKTLLQHLTLFTKIRSPLSMYREPELHQLYTELLSHKNHQVQKLALDCLLCYKHKHLTPYTAHLYNMIDPKSARSELATFRLDSDAGLIVSEHRAALVPIIIRLAMSKLTARTGGRNQNWRGLVVRFIGGCMDDEMLQFVQVSFRQYAKFLENGEDLITTLDNVASGIDLVKFVPPKRLVSALNLLQVVFDAGGLLNDKVLRFLFRILLVVSTLVHGVYKQKDLVHAGYLPVLRVLKNQCQKTVGHFFDQFYRYPFERCELHAVLRFNVWPYLDRLSIEGIYSPTTLLRLLAQCWGSSPRLFPLLNVRNPEDDGKSVMPYVMELLMNDKCNFTVTNAILDMVQKLLTLEADAENDVSLDLEIQTEDYTLSCNAANLNFGSTILLPHVDVILEKFRLKLNATKSKSVGSRDLSILSRISEFVTDSDICHQLLELLLPICRRKCAGGHIGEEILQQLLLTIRNLLQHTNCPVTHLRSLAPLFGIIAFPSCRKILCETVQENFFVKSTAEANQMMELTNIVTEMNAYDAKWLDQPHFERRLNGLKQVQMLLKDGKITTDLGVLIIHNCYYLISLEKDVTLRESATHCIKTMTPKLLDMFPSDTKYIIDDTMFNLIRFALKSKQDNVRSECIGILGHLARVSSKHHTVLKDLNLLTNAEDLEVDFFENLIHLQLFRQGRALVKFCQLIQLEKNTPSSRTLTQFVLPLTTQYLCNERYASKHSIIDSAIETVGVICRLLPWHQYEGLLKYYLAKLRTKVEFQKQLVRLIVAILDGFHFDLSKAQPAALVKTLEKIDTSAPAKDEPIQDETIDDKHDEDNDIITALETTSTDVIEEEDTLIVDIKAVDRIAVLCKSSANRIIYTIKSILLPQLHRTLAELSSHEEAHKVNRHKRNAEREEDDLLRVPISLAVVKLLQKLPKQMLDWNLPGVLMKLCSFLRSPLESVRRCTRETLQKIMLSLGPTYLPVLLDSITPLLLRGFQSHVLVYTVHAVLSALRERFKVGDMDRVLATVSKLCMADLFGVLSDEKDVGKIGSKTSEAKSTKSFDTLQMLSQYLTDQCLMDLIVPLKDILLKSHSHKLVTKVQSALRHISQGLIENTFISNKSLLTFAYGVSSESIPQLLAKDNTAEVTEKEKARAARYPESCFIIPAAPKRHSSLFKSSRIAANTNTYVLVEFGLRVCHMLLKRDKLRSDEGNVADYRGYLDPFVAVFDKCLLSTHVKLCTVTMQCLAWILKYDLPSMQSSVETFTTAIFSILHKYAAAGLSKGDNFDLVVSTFKTISTFLRHSTIKLPLTIDQLALLLMYAEQDLHSNDRQVTAFHLLRAILSRRPDPAPAQLHGVIQKTAELSVRSEAAHVRSQARSCVHQYMLDFPIGAKKLDDMVGWYVKQLSYELEPGRLMTIETLEGFIYAFPQPVLKKYCGTFLMTLGARLVNDESPQCRKNIGNCITTMLKKLHADDVNELFDIIMLWFKDDKITTRQLAAQLCGLLIAIEKTGFERRLQILSPIIIVQFCGQPPKDGKPGCLVRLHRAPIVADISEVDTPQARVRDHYVFQLLQMLQKLAAHCPKFLQDVDMVERLSIQIQVLLGHAHEWVRLAAAQFLGYVLATVDVKRLVDLIQTDSAEETGYLYSDPVEQIKSLTLDLCAQLQPGDIRSDLAEQVIKNLVFLAQVLQHVPQRGSTNIARKLKQTKEKIHQANDRHNGDTNSDSEDELTADDRDRLQINLIFLTKRMRKIVNSEIVETPQQTTLRTEVFKWIGAITRTLDVVHLRTVVHHLLAPLVREINTTSIEIEREPLPQIKELRQLANDVIKLLKGRIGIDLYTETVARIQRLVMSRRAERKRTRTQLALTDPELFAKKKIRRHEKKRVAKKRKIAQRKGDVKPKKRRIAQLPDNSDVM